MGGETQIVDGIEWFHPREDESGSDFCRRMGWGPGDVLLYSHSADGDGRSDEPRRHIIIKLDDEEPGHPQFNVSMRVGGPRGYKTREKMVSTGLRMCRATRLGSGVQYERWDSTWPWAKAPPGGRARRRRK